MKSLLILFLSIACLQGAFANLYIAETDTAEYVSPTDTTTYIPPVDTTFHEPVDTSYYEPVDTGHVVIPDTPAEPSIYVPVIREGDNVIKFPHWPVTNDIISPENLAKQEFTMTIEGDYLHIKGTLVARGYKEHYIHYQIIGDSVHLQRFDMDPESTDMILHNVDILIPGFTEDYYKVTLAEQHDVPLYRQYMVMSRAVTKVADVQPIPNWIGAFWSYAVFEFSNYTFTRYTVLDKPEIIEGKTYYPLVEFKESKYEEGKELRKWRIRQEDKRIYVLKEDYLFPERSDLPTLKEFDNDYLLYDFGMKIGDEFAVVKERDEEWYVIMLKESLRWSSNGQIFKWSYLEGDERGWLHGIGGMEHLILSYDNESLNCPCGSILNYFRSADGAVEYINSSNDMYIGFRSDDESVYLYSNRIDEIKQKFGVQIQAIGQTLLCTSPTAVKLEIYTMDAIKVGEAAFANGEATVKVRKTPATYLYIVTYPNGRRESGKVAVK